MFVFSFLVAGQYIVRVSLRRPFQTIIVDSSKHPHHP
jgi:hypothetical protein